MIKRYKRGSASSMVEHHTDNVWYIHIISYVEIKSENIKSHDKKNLNFLKIPVFIIN